MATFGVGWDGTFRPKSKSTVEEGYNNYQSLQVKIIWHIKKAKKKKKKMCT